jgi:hypothetical protein
MNGGIDVLVFIITAVMGLLPDTPFHFEKMDWGEWGDLIGFLIPLSTMFLHMTAIVGAFLIYYAIRLILRWIKMIQ